MMSDSTEVKGKVSEPRDQIAPQDTAYIASLLREVERLRVAVRSVSLHKDGTSAWCGRCGQSWNLGSEENHADNCDAKP